NPPGAATVGRLYAYDVTATDPDGDPLAYSLDTAPAGMSIDSKLGTIRWTPTADETVAQSVALRVVDGLGGFATQTYTIAVRALDLPPNVTSSPPTTAVANKDYSYALQAVDPEGDPLTFTLTSAPTGMTIDSQTGLIDWTPTSAQIGSASISA